VSSGLHPLQPQNLQPFGGSGVFLTALGTWHKHALPFFENAFKHFLQHPFLISKWLSSSLEWS